MPAAASRSDEQPEPPKLVPGVPSALSPLVRRVIAPNPGLMTGPGTNTYLVGIDEVAVVDPGPAVDSHIDAIIGASMRDRVRWVLLTHTHPDHWPAAQRIREETGAVLAGFGAKIPKADNFDLKLDLVLTDGATIEGTEFRLEALHTPGHAPNHLCFFLEEERMLFTGDHVLNGTTTVVNPQRGGDMVQYLASLDRLRKIKRVSRIAPGHGDVIVGPEGVPRRVRRAPQDARASDPQAPRPRPGQDRRHRAASCIPIFPKASSRWPTPGAGPPREAQGRRQGRGLGVQRLVVESVNRWAESGRTL